MGNEWIDYCKKYQDKHNCSWKEALSKASKTYKKKKSDPEETVQENSDRSQTTSAVSIETGTRLAIFEFEGKGISVPLAARMTEEFRNTVRRLNIFEVQDRGLTQRINIFRPETDDYWDCWNKDCAVERGNYLVSIMSLQAPLRIAMKINT